MTKLLFFTLFTFWLALSSITFAKTPLNVRDFGAAGDGKTKDTEAIQKALDACAAQGGGEVIFPAGDYLVGSLNLPSDTTIHLEKGATLTGSPELDDYPIIQARWEGRWIEAHRALISANKANRIAIIGPGTIAGNPTLGGRQMPRRPCVMEFIGCVDVRLEDFTATQTKMWTIHPTYCEQVAVKNLTIRGTGGNSDGVDVDSCKHVVIENCDIATGDDCIALKSGRGMEGYREAQPTEDVLIRDCSFSDNIFACIGIGSETSGGIRNVRIEHCKFTFAKTFAIYIKSRPGRGAFIENISANDLDVQTAPNGFLRVNLLSSGIQDPEPVPGDEGIPNAKNYRFSNIKVNCGTLVDAREVSPSKPVDGFALVNVSGTCKKGIALANMTHVELKDIKVSGFDGPLQTGDNVAGVGLENAATPERTLLWNGRNLSGWKIFLSSATVDPQSMWSVGEENVLCLTTKTFGYLRTEKSFSNYHLHVEWRWPKDAPANTNSGVFVHVNGGEAIWPQCYECQLKAGEAGMVSGLDLDIPDAPLINKRKRAPKLAKPSEKAFGEWNAYDIYAHGDFLEVFVNGVRQNRVEKLPVTSGNIGLQMEGFLIEFRNVWTQPF